MKPDQHQPADHPPGGQQPAVASVTPDQVANLIGRVAAKDRAAFEQLYQHTAPKLLGTVLRILKDRGWADDVVQDSYLNIWQKAGQFDAGRSSPITWLVSIARNRAIDELRKHPAGRTTTSDELDELAAGQQRVEDQLDGRQAVSRLNHCIDLLEKDRQDMVRLAYLNGWSRDELSSHFDQPVNTVKTWLHRALKQIKRCLEP